MIISGFIYLATLVIGLILAVFPVSNGLPIEFTNAISTLTGYVGILDPLVPIATLAQAVAIILLYEAVIFTFRGTVWIYQRIPFIGK